MSGLFSSHIPAEESLLIMKRKPQRSSVREMKPPLWLRSCEGRNEIEEAFLYEGWLFSGYQMMTSDISNLEEIHHATEAKWSWCEALRRAVPREAYSWNSQPSEEGPTKCLFVKEMPVCAEKNAMATIEGYNQWKKPVPLAKRRRENWRSRGV